MLRDEVAEAPWPDRKPTHVGGGYLGKAGLPGAGCSPDRKISMPERVEMAEEMLGEIIGCGAPVWKIATACPGLSRHSRQVMVVTALYLNTVTLVPS